MFDLSRSATFGSKCIPACCMVFSAVASVEMTALASLSGLVLCVGEVVGVLVFLFGALAVGVGVVCRRCCGSCLLLLLLCRLCGG